MARGNLTGFVARKKAGDSTSESSLVDIMYKSSLNKNTTYGEVSNEQEADAVISDLKRLPQTARVQEKILDIENKKLGLRGNIVDAVSSKDIFNANLESMKKSIAQESHTDIQGKLIPAYAQLYTDAAADFEEALGKKLQNSRGALTPDELAYRDKLNKQADFYNQLANAYIWPDKDGKIGTGLNTGEIAVLVDTNPASGRINSLEIVPSDDVPEDYMPTNVKTNVSPTQSAEGLPMYLRAFKTVQDGKIVHVSKLGNKNFVTDASTNKETGEMKGLLKYKGQGAEGRNWWQKLWGVDSADDDEDAVKEKGILLDGKSVKFDAYDIPDGALVKVGSKTYLQRTQGELYEIAGKTSEEVKTNLTRILSESNINPAHVKTYYANKDFVLNPDGNSKIKAVINDNYFKVGDGSAPGSPASSMVSPRQIPISSSQVSPENSVIAPSGDAIQVQGNPSAAFFDRKNRASAPKDAPARTGNDVVEAGRSFFAGNQGSLLTKINNRVSSAVSNLFS